MGASIFDVADARALTYADATFDRTLSLLVLQFIPDMDRAILEMCRVTRPGGIVGACVWDAEAAGQGLVHVFWDAAVALDPSVEARHVRNRGTNRRGGLAGKFGAHGLVEVTETTLTVVMEFTGFDDFWLPHLEPAGPVGAYVAGLSTEHQAALQACLRRAVLGDLPEGPFTLHTLSRAVRGRVPSGRVAEAAMRNP